MKLAFCLFNYFPFGGLQRDFLRIAQECVRRGHTVDVFTMGWEGEKDPNLNLILLPIRGLQNHSRAKYFAEQVKPQVTQHDLVVGFNKMPGLDIYYAADTCYQAKASKKSFFYRLLPRYRHLVAYEDAVFASHQKTHILLISEKQQPEFQYFYQTQSNRLHLLPPGIAKERIAPSNASEIREKTRAEWNILEKDYLLLMVGSGFKTKGLDRCLKAIAYLPLGLRNHCRFFIIGQDSSSRFKKQAKRLGILNQILFLGGRSDVQRFLLAADLLLHPAYNENTGTVLLEATISGLPVLTTDVCGYASYIEKANSGKVLSSPFNQKQFNTLLEDMLRSPFRNSWRMNGLNFADQQEIYTMPERAVDIIESFKGISCSYI